MRRTLLVILFAAALGIVNAGFVSALPAPASSLHLPLLLVIGLIASFRFVDAFTAAAAAGITLDAVSSLPFGTNLLVTLGAALLATVLFTRVFTNHSWTGLLGMNAAAFLGMNAMLGLARLLRAVFAGWPVREAVFRTSPGTLAGALALQIAAVIVFAFVAGRLKGTFKAFFITR